MTRKVVLFLLGVFLLSQCSAKPTTKSDSSSSEESQEIEPTPRNQLLIFTLTEFAILGRFTIIEGRTILKKVLKDPVVLESNSELLQSNFVNLTKFVEKVEKFEQNLPKDNDAKIQTIFELVLEFSDIAEHYNTTELKHPTAEDRLIEVSLKKNGLDQLEEDFGKRFTEFSLELYTILDKYFNSLSTKERENEKKMIDWYKEYKDEQDVEKKVEIFSKFFELYE